ncbi:STAS domain-containing protein [Methylobacterium oryzihabitans]|uniref:STAS domain-containing protein n=1 Tax=Methylobacterium oryzihabitans TaxID=2499852 RepID=A0A3S2VD61_9HYPH|nr:STAS domain-containing protein [Methylobacterium oryzihabitans]RVU21719.1 STAS domain-containing protein [Methylobacterium oryzihabitans]
MSEPRHIALPADCNLRTIRALHGEIAAALAGASDLTLDGAAVERADVTFVQLIAATVRTAERRLVRVSLVAMSEAACAALARAGLPDLGRPA